MKLTKLIRRKIAILPRLYREDANYYMHKGDQALYRHNPSKALKMYRQAMRDAAYDIQLSRDGKKELFEDDNISMEERKRATVFYSQELAKAEKKYEEAKKKEGRIRSSVYGNVHGKKKFLSGRGQWQEISLAEKFIAFVGIAGLVMSLFFATNKLTGFVTQYATSQINTIGVISFLTGLSFLLLYWHIK